MRYPVGTRFVFSGWVEEVVGLGHHSYETVVTSSPHMWGGLVSYDDIDYFRIANKIVLPFKVYYNEYKRIQ